MLSLVEKLTLNGSASFTVSENWIESLPLGAVARIVTLYFPGGVENDVEILKLSVVGLSCAVKTLFFQRAIVAPGNPVMERLTDSLLPTILARFETEVPSVKDSE